MGCGASVEPLQPIEDLVEGEMLEATKQLWLWEDPAATKQVTMVSSGVMMKVLSTETKDGPGNSGMVQVEALKSQGWITSWARGGSTGNGPKTGFLKRVGGGTAPEGTLAKPEPADAPVMEEKEMGA
jgi:hypothetical protein